MTEQEILDKISHYKFYHIIPLTETIATPGNPVYLPAQNLCLRMMEKLDFRDKRVLDVGCRDGLYSFKAESLGAREVIGIDNDLSLPATEFLIPFFNSKIKMVQINLYDLTATKFGLFDIILFPGVLYHLRYPFWGLRILRDILKLGGDLIIETAIWRGESRNAFLFCPIEAESPYEPSSCTFFNEKGLLDTLTSLGFTAQAIRYVPESSGFSRRRKEWLRQMKTCLSGNRPPIRQVSRAVLHCTYRGIDRHSRYITYWEGEHAIHSTIGG
ncbi:DUF1698 domain-containing protein [candidate division KSB1 bacterium]|nr:DUF1698 domain-containing protein [candidate division KSB1 bacterium]RQW08109.1 MAG: DUF1698 domain-containing protein [candidate division KSB1 bacterium]